MTPVDSDEFAAQRPISERTPVSLGLTLLMVSGIVAVAYTGFQTNANSKEIEELKQKQNAISAIQTDVAVIKAKLEDLVRKMGTNEDSR